MAALDDRERIHPDTPQQWRQWLAGHHDSAPGVWVVTWRKAAGRDTLSYDEIVCEALAFGWVDSLPRSLDDQRTMLYVSPRTPGSGWSRPNKERVERLLAEDRMAPAGRAVIDAAKADGSWSSLDDVENLVVPDDLGAAFDAVAGARDNWEAFPRSAKRGILEWISLARRPQTRTARIRETAEKAGRGERAAQWSRRSARADQSRGGGGDTVPS